MSDSTNVPTYSFDADSNTGWFHLDGTRADCKFTSEVIRTPNTYGFFFRGNSLGEISEANLMLMCGVVVGFVLGVLAKMICHIRTPPTSEGVKE